MAQEPADKVGAGGFKLDWTTALGIVGAAAALGLWINVVGGAVLWTRFEEAELPATHIVGIVPNTTLLAIGIEALILPLIVATVAVGVFYVARRGPKDTRERGATSRGARRLRIELRWLLGCFGLWPSAPADRISLPPRTGMRGFGRVLVLLFALAMIAVFGIFGGDVSWPADTEYILAWALASPLLVLGAATYGQVARSVERNDLVRGRVYLVIALLGFGAILLIGFLAGHWRAAAYVAPLSIVAALLAYALPPGTVRGTTAGGWLVVFYVLLGLLLFVCGHGSLTFPAADKQAAVLVAVLGTTVALLFLHVVGDRSNSARFVAAVMFGVVAVWGGAINYLRERVTTPSFDLTAMLRKPPAANADARLPVSGFLIARTGDAILVATTSKVFEKETWRVLVVPRDEVEVMSVGPNCTFDSHYLPVADKMADELAADERGSLTSPAISPATADARAAPPCRPRR